MVNFSKLSGFIILVALMTSCATHTNVIYSDVIGFSEKVDGDYFQAENKHRGMFKNLFKQIEPSNLVDKKDAEVFKSGVSKIPQRMRGENTSVYYAVETACDRIRYVRKRIMKRDKQTKYYLFLMTDGLDNWSEIAAKEDKQILFPIKHDKYPERVQKKLKKAMGLGKNLFEVYPMIMEGADILSNKDRNKMSDETFDKWIESQMECFKYSSKGDAPKLIRATDYEKIFEDLKEQFKTSSYSFRVPKSYQGNRIKMNFESIYGEKATLIGTFKKKGFDYIISDIELKGININKASHFYRIEGNALIPSNKDYRGGDIEFKIEGITNGNNKRYDINKREVQQEYESNGIWILNSEYKENAMQNQNTYFILVIDASKSLDGKKGEEKGFEKEMEMARKIVDLIIE